MTVKEPTQEASPARPGEAVSPLREEIRARAQAARERWQAARDRESGARKPWKKDFTTVSGQPVPELVTPDQSLSDPIDGIGVPGEFPYVRGIHPTGYRGKLWTMRQFAGFGSAADTNQRFKYLLAQGQTGLSVAFHLPTLYGYDSDHKMAAGEVGKCGVAIDSLADMEALFDGIPLGEVTTSMTINSTAPILFAMYLAVAEKQGVDIASRVSGTLQNDILKEYIAQKEYIYPPRPSMRLITDQFSFAAERVPKWNTISISGYHIREAGSTALQELAFTLRDGMEYVEYGVRAGLDVDTFAPRLSFFFNSHNDFFEEIAKFRAARKIWATVMRERYGAKNPRSWMLPLPHPDGGLLAHRAAAGEQRRAHRRAGARRRCSAGPSRCTPTRSTRRWRCRPRRTRGSRCGRSRSWRTSRVSSTPSIRSAEAGSSRR